MKTFISLCCLLLSLFMTPAFAQTDVTTTGSFGLTGRYYQPPCQLTESAQITIDLSKCATSSSGGTESYWIPVTSTDTLEFPINPQPGQVFEIKLSHAATGNSGYLNFTTGWRVALGSQTSNKQPNWSAANGVDDKIVCESEPSTASDAQNGYIMSCGNVVQDIAPVASTAVTQLAAGTYALTTTQNSNTVGIDINGGNPEAFVQGNASYAAEWFVWDGKSQLQKHDCGNPYFADSNGSLACNKTQTDSFQIVASGSGYTVEDLTTKAWLNLISTCSAGFSACVGFSTTTPATVWTVTSE